MDSSGAKQNVAALVLKAKMLLSKPCGSVVVVVAPCGRGPCTCATDSVRCSAAAVEFTYDGVSIACVLVDDWNEDKKSGVWLLAHKCVT